MQIIYNKMKVGFYDSLKYIKLMLTNKYINFDLTY